MAYTQGTTIKWADSAQSPTYTMTLSTLGDDVGRQGPKHDWGAGAIPIMAKMEVQVEMSSAPTAGEVVNFYIAEAADNTNFDGEASGTDAALTEADAARWKLVGSLGLSNDADPQRASFVIFPSTRYICVGVVNKGGYAFETTTSNHHIWITPLS